MPTVTQLFSDRADNGVSGCAPSLGHTEGHKGSTDPSVIPLIDFPWAALREPILTLWVWEARFEF